MKKRVIIIFIIILIIVSIFFAMAIIKNNAIELEASAREKIVYIKGNEDYDFKKNIKTNIPVKNIDCSPSVLILGSNDVTCKIISKKNFEKMVSFRVIKSSTYHKNIIFFGDSITSGFGSKSKHYSWASYIENNYDFDTVINAGIIDYRVSPYENPNKWLVTQVKNHYNDDIEYDYVIMQGGVNDVLYQTPIGNMTDSFAIDDFDTNTFIGGLETYIASVIDKWKDVNIGYIITYQTPKYTERGIIYTESDYLNYYQAMIKVLKKWNIPYLDLFNGSVNGTLYSDILAVNTTKYLPDYLHLNDEGYDLIAPYIYKWLQTIDTK